MGNISTGRSQGGACYSTEGVSQTLCSGPHSWASGSLIEIKKGKNKK